MPLYATLLTALMLTAAPPTVTVESLAERPSAVPTATYSSLDIALRNLDFSLLSRKTTSPRTRAFGAALRSLFSGRPEEAHKALSQLTSEADEIGHAARGILLKLYFDARDYARLRNDSITWSGSADPFAEALATVPAQRIEARARPVSSSLGRHVTGVPVVTVKAGDARLERVPDTGASLTVIRAGDVGRLGARMVAKSDVAVGTATEIEVRGRLAVIPRLEVGSVTVYNHTALVFPDETLDLTLPDGTPLVLGGILGWNLLRELRVELDFLRARSSFQLSKARLEKRKPNFFWLGYPLVRLRHASGQPLLFGLDTGSRNTSMNANLFTKVDLGPLRREVQVLGGAGGSVEFETQVAELLELVIDSHLFSIPDARQEEHDEAYFVREDGVLGSDIVQEAVLILDFPNHRLDIELAGK